MRSCTLLLRSTVVLLILLLLLATPAAAAISTTHNNHGIIHHQLQLRGGYSHKIHKQQHKRQPPTRKQEKRVSVDVALQGTILDHAAAPLVIRPWLFAYKRVPPLYIFGTNFDVGFTLASCLFLTVVDYSTGFFLKRQLSRQLFSHDQIRSLAGSCTSILHSVVLVSGLVFLLFPLQRPSARLIHAPSLWWQQAATAMIQFCTGYMIYDAAVQFIADKWQKGKGPVLSVSDWLFLGHHAATSLYMTSCRLLQAGHVSAMILMAAGEFTAPFQNLYRVARVIHLHPKSWYYTTAAMAWAILYLVFRVLLGPVIGIYLTRDLLSSHGRAVVPVEISAVWLFLCWGVLLGSIPWIKSAMQIVRHGAPTEFK